MSNQPKDFRIKNISQLLEQFSERVMRRINTVMPAEITQYDSGTRLAQVQPLLRLVTTDGDEMDRPMIEGRAGLGRRQQCGSWGQGRTVDRAGRYYSV